MGEVKECIDREEAIRICERLRDKTDNDDMAFALNWAIQSIKGIPAADVKPVARGKWLTEYEPDGKPYCLHCSVCDDDFSIIGITTASSFCPNCGADMREVNDEAT